LVHLELKVGYQKLHTMLRQWQDHSRTSINNSKNFYYLHYVFLDKPCINIYIYIWREREGERGRERKRGRDQRDRQIDR
jgi:tRNA splicing ligase